jgi:hypothetical protein
MANEKPDELDRMLDAALTKYAAAELRTGLEERVLATLRAEQARVPDRAWWRWSVLAAVAAMVIIVAILAWRSSVPSHPVVANHPSSATEGQAEPTAQIVLSPTPVRKAKARRSHPLIVSRSQPHLRPPKLEQFPSPQPLSDQEKLLLAYVTEDPKRAVLIARARNEALLQEQLEETKGFPLGNKGTGSDKRNNDTTER